RPTAYSPAPRLVRDRETNPPSRQRRRNHRYGHQHGAGHEHNAYAADATITVTRPAIAESGYNESLAPAPAHDRSCARDHRRSRDHAEQRRIGGAHHG